MIVPQSARDELRTAVAKATSRKERAALFRAYARTWVVSEATARRHAVPHASEPPTLSRIASELGGLAAYLEYPGGSRAEKDRRRSSVAKRLRTLARRLKDHE